MKILYFIRDNWQFISSVLLVISSVVVFFLKRKKVINEMDNILLCVFEKLPEFINAAESIKGAEAKKALVLECVSKFVKDQFSVILPDTYLSLVASQIEVILSTPHKKEVSI